MVQILQLNWQLTKVELTDPCTATQRHSRKMSCSAIAASASHLWP